MKRLTLLSLLLYSLSFLPVAVHADAIDLGTDGSVSTVLSAHVGKRVSIILKSGQEMGGTIKAVTEKATHLAEITGKEFYDAVISNKSITAVVVRRK